MNNNKHNTYQQFSNVIKTCYSFTTFHKIGVNKIINFVAVLFVAILIALLVLLLFGAVHANNTNNIGRTNNISNTSNINNISNTNNTNNTNQVWIFSTKDQVFTKAYKISNSWTIRHYHIDAAQNFEIKISQGLSPNKDVAIKQVKQRFNKYRDKWTLGARQAWQGAINAQALNIEKVPAISFDRGNTIIYGVTDLLKALNIHRQARKTRQAKSKN